MSGCSASTMLVSIVSPASTVSATFLARPFTRAESSRAVWNEMFRGLEGKNTKPTASAPASSATSSVSGVESPQILTKVVIAGRVVARIGGGSNPQDQANDLHTSIAAARSSTDAPTDLNSVISLGRVRPLALPRQRS